MKLLTNSRIKTYRACAAKYNFTYNLGLRGLEEREELDFGSAIDLGISAWLDPELNGDAKLDAAISAANNRLSDPYQQSKALAMLTGYHFRWKDEPYFAILIQPEFRGALVNPDSGRTSKVWQLAGKLDSVLQHKETGARYIHEVKTSSEDVGPGSLYQRRLRLDSQVSQYYDGMRILGYPDIAGCIYDVLSKPGIRPFKATPEDKRKYKKGTKELYANQHESDETSDEYALRCSELIQTAPEQFFTRLEVPRTDAEMEDARRDAWQYAQRMQEDDASKRFPKNPDACAMYGKPCPYLPICNRESNASDETMYRRIESVHPELTLFSEVPTKGPEVK